MVGHWNREWKWSSGSTESNPVFVEEQNSMRIKSRTGLGLNWIQDDQAENGHDD